MTVIASEFALTPCAPRSRSSLTIPLCSGVTHAVTGKNAGNPGPVGVWSWLPFRSLPVLKNALSAKAVASLKSGKHRDGEGLQFEVKGGSRRWTFNYMWDG